MYVCVFLTLLSSPSIIECFAVSTAIVSLLYILILSATNVHALG